MIWHNEPAYSSIARPSHRASDASRASCSGQTPTGPVVTSPAYEPGETTTVAVKIRLKRLGKIRAPYYRVVVADSRTKRDGRVIEEIGKYHPTEEPSLVEIDSERAKYWLGVGAQPSEQVQALLKLTGDWQAHRGEAGAESTVRTKQTAEDRATEAIKAAEDDAELRKAKAAEAKATEAKSAEEAESASQQVSDDDSAQAEPETTEDSADEAQA